MRHNSYVITVALLGCTSLSEIAMPAQDTSDQRMDHGSNEMMKSADIMFAMKAAKNGVSEVRMGNLAKEKAGSSDVKAFGEQMVIDHTKANNDLKSIAERKRMTLPDNVNAHDQAAYNKLRKLSGPTFDRAYVKDMVVDHREDVKEFQKESNTGKDEEIKEFASRTLPVLQRHLDEIKAIQSKIQQSGSSKK